LFIQGAAFFSDHFRQRRGQQRHLLEGREGFGTVKKKGMPVRGFAPPAQAQAGQIPKPTRKKKLQWSIGTQTSWKTIVFGLREILL